MRFVRYVGTMILGLLLGLAVSSVAQTPPVPQPTGATPCDTQVQLVEFSRKQVEQIAAQTIAQLQQRIQGLEKQVADAKPHPTPEPPKK